MTDAVLTRSAAVVPVALFLLLTGEAGPAIRAGAPVVMRVPVIVE